MGSADLREMAAGRMDPAGEGMTKAGKICGIVAVCLVAALVLFYAVLLVFGLGIAAIGVGAGAGAGGAGSGP